MNDKLSKALTLAQDMKTRNYAAFIRNDPANMSEDTLYNILNQYGWIYVGNEWRPWIASDN